MAKFQAEGPPFKGSTQELENIIAWVKRELDRAGNVISTEVNIDKKNVAPPRPQDGDIAYADGTNWNPTGGGRGIYSYLNGSWYKMGFRWGTDSLSIGSILQLNGSAIGNANVAYTSFYQSNGMRTGFVGDGSSLNQDMYLYSDIGDVHINAAGANNAIWLDSGILRFPATQNPSAGANDLDDYEEGTWTPTLSSSVGAFGAITYNYSATNWYRKIGGLLLVHAGMRTNSITVGTASGVVTIIGGPFAATVQGAAAVGFSNGFAANHPVSALFSGTTINLYARLTATGSSSALVVTDLGTGASANDVRVTGICTVV